jgi:hypothetical protein
MSHIEEIKGFVAQIVTSLGDSAQELSGDTEYLRATKKVAFISERMNLVDEDLAPPNLISTIHTHLSRAKEQIVSYVTSKEKATFGQFLSSINEAIPVLSSLPVLSNVELDNVTHSFSELTAQKLTELEQRVHALNAEQGKLMGDFQKEWRELIDGSAEKQIAGAKKDLDVEIKKLNDRIDLCFNGEGEKKGWTVLADEKLSEIDGVKERAKNLGVLIADGTTSGSYREQAMIEVEAYKSWRKLTIGIAVLWFVVIFSNSFLTFIDPIVYALWGFELKIAEPATGADLLYERVMSSLPFIAFAAWTSSIASNHRKSALRYKQFELDLAAFEPSLEHADPAARAQAKLEFVKNTFGKNHDVVDPTTADLFKKSLDGITDLAKTLAEKIKP